MSAAEQDGRAGQDGRPDPAEFPAPPSGGIPAVTVESSGRRRTARSKPRLSRHGRLFRSSATGPDLPPLRARGDLFEQTVASTAEYLRSVWPNELAEVTIESAGVPAWYDAATRMPRWRLDVAARRVLLYRVPLERLEPGRHYDEGQYRAFIESCVVRAVAEYLGKDPWDVAPDRFPD